VPLPPGSLLCTVNGNINHSFTFPPDGVCTIITFDSLYWRNQTLEPPYSEAFQSFLDTAMQFNETEFGIGFHQNTLSDDVAWTSIVENATTKMYLDELWDRYRIYHYAQVTGTYFFRKLNYSTLVELAVKGLNMISNLMSDKKHGILRPSYTILHFFLLSPSTWKDVSLDIFVVIVHFIAPDIHFRQCRMIPPVMLSPGLLDQAGERIYRIRMSTGVNYLAQDYRSWPSTTTAALALDLVARWYTPCGRGPQVNNRPQNYSLGYTCGYMCDKHGVTPGHQLQSITSICRDFFLNSTIYTDTTFDSSVAIFNRRRLIATFESFFNLRSK
ncbi:hypothetical protein MTO96_033543, partial [Rhipicephalus appendiculatus]